VRKELCHFLLHDRFQIGGCVDNKTCSDHLCQVLGSSERVSVFAVLGLLSGKEKEDYVILKLGTLTRRFKTGEEVPQSNQAGVNE